LRTISSTFSRLSVDKQTSTSVLLVASQTSLGVNILNYASVSSMTKISSDTIMHVAVSSVNCGLKLKPSLKKKLNGLIKVLNRQVYEYLGGHFSSIDV
jgi:hypothetical protein